MSATAERRRRVPDLADVGDALLSLATTAIGLGIAIAVVDDVGVSGSWPVIVAAAVVAVGDMALRAPMRLLAQAAGAGGALVAGLLAQVLTAWLALTFVPGFTVGSAWGFVAVLVVTSIVMAIGRWLWGANDSEY
ncbi:MAG TPA: phosphodiesterase, partial [Cellulomonas sp.]|nr:phosphodiesterase [Cellulomonas sp.]